MPTPSGPGGSNGGGAPGGGAGSGKAPGTTAKQVTDGVVAVVGAFKGVEFSGHLKAIYRDGTDKYGPYHVVEVDVAVGGKNNLPKATHTFYAVTRTK